MHGQIAATSIDIMQVAAKKEKRKKGILVMIAETLSGYAKSCGSPNLTMLKRPT
jgi:hypothetical protein